jgi:glycine cleavage system H protein
VDFPQELKYSETHEWVRVEGQQVTIGITDYAQDALGDVVYVELPEVGEEILAGKAFGVIESVKAAEDLYAPVTGKVVESNTSVIDEPEIVNDSCYEKGWMIVVDIANPNELHSLLGPDDYRTKVEQEHH